MSAQSWQLENSADEDALHNVARLLSIEARPFLRIAGRVIKENTFASVRPTHLPSPPPDASAADEEAAAREVERQQQAHKIEAWRSEIMNDLELLDYTTLRFELTSESNNAERARYAREKIAIMEKQELVKEEIERLRVELKAAKETLAIRKTYDAKAEEKIFSQKMQRPREAQAIAHAKLDEEIAELEHEVQTAKDTWKERRVQFLRIEEEAKQMLHMIKDEKEEAERKEGMMKDQDDEGDSSSVRGDASRMGTPRPDGAMTPLPISQSVEGSSSLRVPQDRLAPLSRGTSAALSPARSGIVEDTEMVDLGDDAKDVHADDSSGLEEGEDVEEGEHDGERSERADASDRDLDES
ncbi:hypothetical protein K458DRAFT_178407 [Lentithecium fluviatile CBS 122367]|uniref:Uncharacterized protein n=1 Tax=Lentithecium fluviatile CBS 122367 TaxID=1168545 RepID=A0A6G1IFT1_9PLEO|nr:hypothetical protein K458DRAFT_178407 [Lentithecium fluviatile CBS 122367]